jgi:aryl-alcohol dehydrogenase-like predicted oxidoreductase
MEYLVRITVKMFPIPGTKRVKYLEENIGAVQIKFTEAELQKIDTILKSLPPVGDRYPDMSSIDI